MKYWGSCEGAPSYKGVTKVYETLNETAGTVSRNKWKSLQLRQLIFA